MRRSLTRWIFENRVEQTLSDAEEVFPGADHKFEEVRSRVGAKTRGSEAGFRHSVPANSTLSLLVRVEKRASFSPVNIRLSGTAGCRVPLSRRTGLWRRFAADRGWVLPSGWPRVAAKLVHAFAAGGREAFKEIDEIFARLF
jgi:hypothetical protein